MRTQQPSLSTHLLILVAQSSLLLICSRFSLLPRSTRFLSSLTRSMTTLCFLDRPMFLLFP